jgi:hypothetical protein
MIKSFSQFNEELSPELLNKAASKAYNRGQEARGNKFYKASEDSKREQMRAKKLSNYNNFMELTGGKLFGYECNVESTRVNPMGDTWIEVMGKFELSNGKSIDTIFVTDQGIREGVVSSKDTPKIPLKELVLTRGDAMKYHKFCNWWMGEDKPFSVDDYCIKGIHV